MKKAFLLMVVPTLLAALALAQTPAADNTDQTNIKGCMAGSDGNYTVVEDNTGRTFKISSSSVDLKPHLGHDVALIGQRASEPSSAGDAHSFAVTELKMISEQCSAAAAAPAATVAPPAETAVPPAAPPAAATAPAATVVAPTEIAAAPAVIATEPAATVAPPAETAVTPAPAAAEPAATIAAPAEIGSTPAAVAVHAKPAGHKVSAAPAAVAKPPVQTPAATTSETVSAPAAASTAPAATTSSDADSTPAAATTMPAKTAKTGSFAIFIAFAALVILLGILTPVLRRWRKQRMLEGTDAPNLSFTHDAKSDEDKSDPPITRQAA